jgi:hypothetical protein
MSRDPLQKRNAETLAVMPYRLTITGRPTGHGEDHQSINGEPNRSDQ